MAEEKKVFLPDIIDSNKPGEKFEIKNFDEIKEALASILAEFKDFKLTDNYAEAKDLRARLNNAAKALNAKKIAVKKAYLEPYEYGENQVKALIEMIAQASDSIDVQIKEYEENMKKKKEEDIQILFQTFENPRKIPLIKIWNEKWLNAGTSAKAIERDIAAALEKVETDIVNIETLVADEERRAMTVKLYIDYLDMGKAISEEKRVYELTHSSKPKAQEDEVKAEVPADTSDITPDEPVEEFYLSITGTKTQLLEVRDFLKSKGLTFKFERK